MANEEKYKAKEQKAKSQPEKESATKKAATGQKKKEVKKVAKAGETQEKKEEKQEEKESVLKDIMSISGHGGLFMYISQARNGIIVENLETKKRIQAFATMKVSSLEDIAIFTDEEEVPLEEVMKKIFSKENGKPAIDHKSDPTQLKTYFEEILPEYDRERVYMSDIKKVVHWYNLLIQFDLLKFEKETKKKEDSKDS
jgi:hypothetical protein